MKLPRSKQETRQSNITRYGNLVYQFVEAFKLVCHIIRNQRLSLSIPAGMAHFEDDRSRNMPRRPTQGAACATTRSQQVFRPKPPHDDREPIPLGHYSHPEEHFVSPVHASGFGNPSHNWFEPMDSPHPGEYSHGARSQFPGYPYKYHHAGSERPTPTSPGYYDQYTPPPPYHGSPNELYNPSSLYPYSTTGAHHYKTPHASSTTDHSTDRMVGSSPPKGPHWHDGKTLSHSYSGPYDYSPRDYAPRDYSSRDFSSRDHTPSSRGCAHPEHIQAPPEHIFTSSSDPIFDLRNDDVLCGRGGRFLKRTKSPGRFGWKEIGEQRAYEKACQALRENAPEIRRRLAAQELAAVSSSDSISQTDGAGTAGRKPGVAGGYISSIH
eukprot:scaffold4214_cov172-Amphora_coffeaeformis.AAC.4